MPCLPNNTTCKSNLGGCIIKLPSKCVTYDGPATTNIGYVTNMPITDILLLIDEAIGSSSGQRGYISTSPTVLVSSLGTQSNPYVLTARRSSDADNALTIGTDGALYVPSLNIDGFIQNQDTVAQDADWYISGTTTNIISDNTKLVIQDFMRTSVNSDIHAILGSRHALRISCDDPAHVQANGPEAACLTGIMTIPGNNTQNLTHADLGMNAIHAAAGVLTGASGNIRLLAGFNAQLGVTSTTCTVTDAYWYKVQKSNFNSNGTNWVNAIAFGTPDLTTLGTANTTHFLIGNPVNGNWNCYYSTSLNNYLGTGITLINRTTDDTSGSKLQVNGTITTSGIRGGVNSSDTLTLLNYNGSTTGAVLDQSGLTIGGGTASTNSLLKTIRTFINPTSNPTGARLFPSAYNTTTPNTGAIFGAFIVPSITGLNTQNWTNDIGMQGISTAPTIAAGATGNIQGIVGHTIAANFLASGATITNYTGIRSYIESVSVTPITNSTLLLTGISTTPSGTWGWYHAGSTNNFLGVGTNYINTTTDNGTGSKLQINGRASGSNAIAVNEFVTLAQLNALPSATLITGTNTQTTNGILITFNIPHGLGVTPSYYSITPRTPSSVGYSSLTADTTNIIVGYDVAPLYTGTNNWIVNWEAKP